MHTILLLPGALLVSLPALALPCPAHRSTALFELTTTTTLSGTV